jgi:hypothetical protein
LDRGRGAAVLRRGVCLRLAKGAVQPVPAGKI